MHEFKTRLSKQFAVTIQLDAVLAGGWKGQAVELEGEVCDGSRILELHRSLPHDDGWPLLVGVNDPDG